MTLPLVISAGDAGHIGDHEEIHGVLVDVVAPEVFSMARYYQDTLANIPSAGRAGSIFVATDTGETFIDNGSSWVSLSALLNDFDVSVMPSGASIATFKAPICRVRKSTNQSVANATGATLTFDGTSGEEFDPAGLLATTTRFTAARDGHYLAACNIIWASNSTGWREIRVLKNGTTQMDLVTQNASGSPDYQNSITPVHLGVGDYIEFQGYQTSGGTLDVLAGTVGSLWFHSDV